MTQEEFQNNVLPLKNKLYCFALSILKNKEDARDVVQDTMLKIWQNNKALDEYKNIEAWCMTMTRNRSLDKLKLKSNRHERVEDQTERVVRLILVIDTLKLIETRRLEHYVPAMQASAASRHPSRRQRFIERLAKMPR